MTHLKQKPTKRQIHDEVTQTLVAVNLKLLSMKKSVKKDSDSLKKQVADTQRLVQQSRKPIYRLARKIVEHHEA